MGIGKDMLAVNVHSNKSYVCFSSISWKSYCCNKVEVNLATLSFWDITGFMKLVSGVCLVAVYGFI